MPSLLLALLLLAPQSADLGDIVVIGNRLSPLLSVTVEGDVPPDVLVRSAPEGVRCGASRYRYDAYAAPRLCWMRRPVGEVIRLQAESDAGFTIRWEGCEPTDDGRGCTVTSGQDGQNVKAYFTRR